jgi:hypothetical protein
VKPTPCEPPRGRQTFSQGVWVPHAAIKAVRAGLAAERSQPRHARQRAADALRRERRQADDVASFRRALLDILAFDARYADLAGLLTTAVTEHATSVGSGTVARNQRTPVERSAEAAVIALIRHQTTANDRMAIARVEGRRREVRRQLAGPSKSLLDAYREGREVDASACPLQQALSGRTFPAAHVPAWDPVRGRGIGPPVIGITATGGGRRP